MAGVEFRMERGREGVLLPDGRHMARIHMLDIGIGHRVAGLRQERRVIRYRIVRVEAHHTACGVMEIFKEPRDRHIRPDLFHEQQLAPAGMAQDQVGPEALVLLQLASSHGGGEPRAGRPLPGLWTARKPRPRACDATCRPRSSPRRSRAHSCAGSGTRSVGQKHCAFDFGFVFWFVRSRGDDCCIAVAGHVRVGTVDRRIIKTGLGHTGFQIVANHLRGQVAEEVKGAHMAGYPIGQALRPAAST